MFVCLFFPNILILPKTNTGGFLGKSWSLPPSQQQENSLLNPFECIGSWQTVTVSQYYYYSPDPTYQNTDLTCLGLPWTEYWTGQSELGIFYQKAGKEKAETGCPDSETFL